MGEQAATFDFSPPRRGRPAALQMAPLIDIVFLLICFYLLVAQLIRTQKDPAVDLPVMVYASSAAEAPAELVVNLRADGSVTVGGRAVADGELPRLIHAELARAVEAGTPLRVVVRADRRQRYGKLDELLRLCKQAGLSKVVFRAREESAP